MKNLLNKKVNVIAAGCLLITLLILLTTNPKEVPIAVLMLPPLLSFAALALIAYQVLGLFSVGKGRTRAQRTTLALICAGVPILLLVLKSVDQLSARDIILFSVLVGLLTFYLGRLRLGTRRE